VIIGLRGNGDDRIVSEKIRTGRERNAADRVAVTVGEFLGRKIVTERQRFEDHRVITVRSRLQVKQQRGGACDFIGETATNADREVEFRFLDQIDAWWRPWASDPFN
jgi:hypothetical protein